MKRECNIVEYSPVVKEPMVLKNHADLAPVVRDLAVGDFCKVAAVYQQLSPGWPIKQGDEAHQCGFAGTGMAGDEGHRALFYPQIDVAEAVLTIIKPLADAFEMNH